MSDRWKIAIGDCIEVMRGVADSSVDAIVTDPPYGLNFMGKKWDYDVPSVEVWAECLRVLKPGGHLLAFAGTRTQHRMAVRIEDAGFEIRDMIGWVYASGFPKSLDVSKAIDKAAGIWRGRAGNAFTANNAMCGPNYESTSTGEPATPEAQAWQGWGTALKPALEPITVARKPLGGTVAENVLAHGTGAINVDGCRVGAELVQLNAYSGRGPFGESQVGNDYASRQSLGRWPANLIHDGSDEVVGLFPQANGGNYPQGGKRSKPSDNAFGIFKGNDQPARAMGDSGSAARFFYCPKASKADRDEGCDGLEAGRGGALNMRTDAHSQANGMDTGPRRNHHPTVKPTALMRYLCRLVTPPGGLVLDPFTGSGSTGKAAILEGFRFLGIERDPEYAKIAEARIGAI